MYFIHVTSSHIFSDLLIYWKSSYLAWWKYASTFGFFLMSKNRIDCNSKLKCFVCWLQLTVSNYTNNIYDPRMRERCLQSCSHVRLESLSCMMAGVCLSVCVSVCMCVWPMALTKIEQMTQAQHATFATCCISLVFAATILTTCDTNTSTLIDWCMRHSEQLTGCTYTGVAHSSIPQARHYQRPETT